MQIICPHIPFLEVIIYYYFHKLTIKREPLEMTLW